MSEAAYIEMRQAAAAALVEDGQEITLTKVAGGAVGATGAPAATTETAYKVYAVKRAYKPREVDGDLIQRGDVLVTMAALTTTGAVLPEPAPQDKLTIGSDTWIVQSCEPVQPASVAILFKVQARKP